ncbi:MAG: hypothetical protein AB9M60_16025 [Leptothrix sp. (in: b-proteobacteria)]
MADYFHKTEQGRRELRERSARLTRPARNLLLILDSSKPLGAWVEMIQGATLADGVALLEAGLIEAQAFQGGPETRPASFEPTAPAGWMESNVAPLGAAGPAAAPGAASPAPHATTPATRPAPLTLPGELSDLGDLPFDPQFLPTLTRAITNGTLGYTELYDSLNALLRENLGLIRGYRYTMRIERARDITELQIVARDFIAEVQRLRGATIARMVQRALGFDA